MVRRSRRRYGSGIRQFILASMSDRDTRREPPPVRGSPDFGRKFVEQYPNRVIVSISGEDRQHHAGKVATVSVMSGFGVRARIDDFTAG
jgi:hypothetical protein